METFSVPEIIFRNWDYSKLKETDLLGFGSFNDVVKDTANLVTFVSEEPDLLQNVKMVSSWRKPDEEDETLVLPMDLEFNVNKCKLVLLAVAKSRTKLNVKGIIRKGVIKKKDLEKYVIDSYYSYIGTMSAIGTVLYEEHKTPRTFESFAFNPPIHTNAHNDTCGFIEIRGRGISAVCITFNERYFPFFRLKDIDEEPGIGTWILPVWLSNSMYYIKSYEVFKSETSDVFDFEFTYHSVLVTDDNLVSKIRYGEFRYEVGPYFICETMLLKNVPEYTQDLSTDTRDYNRVLELRKYLKQHYTK